MKKSALLIFIVAVLVLQQANAELFQGCKLTATLLNQDPYPAVPGDYVKVVIQIAGMQNPNCEAATFKLTPTFPFSLDPGVSDTINLKGNTYVRDYPTEILLPFKIRVDKDAIDGDATLEGKLQYSESSTGSVEIIQFDIDVEGTATDFEVSVQDYDHTTNTLTLALLNTGENDVTALTVEIPKQENIEVKGSNRDIVGDLDTSEDTTAKFEAVPKDGEIEVLMHYTDSVNVRRTVTEKVLFDSSYFVGRKADVRTGPSVWFYITLLLVIVWFVLWFRRRRKEKRLKNSLKNAKK